MLELGVMRRVFWGFMFMMTAMTWAIDASADQSIMSGKPCLLGSWVGERSVINKFGSEVSLVRLEIDRIEGNTLHGISSWKSVDGSLGHNTENKVVRGDAEIVIGAIDNQGLEFYLVETEESGIIRGRFVGNDKIELFLMQSGAYPVAGF